MYVVVVFCSEIFIYFGFVPHALVKMSVKFRGSSCFRKGNTQWRTQVFFFPKGDSTNSVEDRGQRERGSGGGAPSQGFWRQL